MEHLYTQSRIYSLPTYSIGCRTGFYSTTPSSAVSKKVLHVACIGHGTVGGAFLDQLTVQRQALYSEESLDIRIVAIASSHALLLDPEGIGADWRRRKAETPYSSDPVGSLIDYQRSHRLPNMVVVDNTASAQIAARYPELVRVGCHLVSSNKIANTHPLAQYRALRQLLETHRRHYLYETNVGAGLPLIDHLHLLHTSGDQITAIRGLFSGSLGYLFSTGDLIQALPRAIREGYTEPDPRLDLSGMDVARKLLILAREVGLSVELEDIEVQSLVPPHLRDCSVEAFLEKLPDVADYIREMVQPAEGEVLRYVGELTTEGKPRLRCGLKSVPAESSLGQVEGPDSCFEIYTRSYGTTPFVIRGAGAGAEVTARGVFGDLLRLSTRL